MEPRPFDVEHYEDEAEEEDELDEEGRTRLKLKVENTIRWRKVVDKTTGRETVQSNARVVKWSDGTQSLIVGNEKFGKFFYSIILTVVVHNIKVQIIKFHLVKANIVH